MDTTDKNICDSVFKDYPDVLDIKQVSYLLGVSDKTTYKIIKDGSLPSLKVGREYRVLKVNLIKYLELFEK